MTLNIGSIIQNSVVYYSNDANSIGVIW